MGQGLWIIPENSQSRVYGKRKTNYRIPHTSFIKLKEVVKRETWLDGWMFLYNIYEFLVFN